jgi:hypothetical protein
MLQECSLDPPNAQPVPRSDLTYGHSSMAHLQRTYKLSSNSAVWDATAPSQLAQKKCFCHDRHLLDGRRGQAILQLPKSRSKHGIRMVSVIRDEASGDPEQGSKANGRESDRKHPEMPSAKQIFPSLCVRAHKYASWSEMNSARGNADDTISVLEIKLQEAVAASWQWSVPLRVVEALVAKRELAHKRTQAQVGLP